MPKILCDFHYDFSFFPAATINTVIQKYFTMGCVPGKEPLSEKDLEFISQNTVISREYVEEQYTILSEWKNYPEFFQVSKVFVI